jgi:hypothetical protein
MNDINRIINETIKHYVNENNCKTLNENKQKNKEESQIKKLLKRLKDYINIAKIGRELYPGHTKTGAQSQFRKKVEGEQHLHFTIKELNKLKKILSKFL